MTAIKRSISQFAASVPIGARVLDVGCGLRPYESLFGHVTYIGIDVLVIGRGQEGKSQTMNLTGSTFRWIQVPSMQ